MQNDSPNKQKENFMTKQELQERFNNYKNYFFYGLLKEAKEDMDYTALYYDSKNDIKSLEKWFIETSERYASLAKIGKMFRKDDPEKAIRAYAIELNNKYDALLDKSYDLAEKEACHWKREGFDSKEDYREDLINDITYIYGWNDLAYEIAVLDNLMRDIDKVLGFEDWR